MCLYNDLLLSFRCLGMIVFWLSVISTLKLLLIFLPFPRSAKVNIQYAIGAVRSCRHGSFILSFVHRFTGLTQLRKASEEQRGVLGHLLVAAAKIVAQEKLDGYRLVINDGESAGQSVFHLHLHILAGRDLTWPPG